MAINTELPISKVVFDDQEISLASSGGGSEEMKIESYTNTHIGTLNSRILELYNAGKLLEVRMNVISQIILSSSDIKEAIIDITTGKGSSSGDKSIYLNADNTFVFRPSSTTRQTNGSKRILLTNKYMTSGRILELTVTENSTGNSLYQSGIHAAGTTIYFYSGYASLSASHASKYTIDIVYFE